MAYRQEYEPLGLIFLAIEVALSAWSGRMVEVWDGNFLRGRAPILTHD
jgi:hypothetical protein